MMRDACGCRWRVKLSKQKPYNVLRHPARLYVAYKIYPNGTGVPGTARYFSTWSSAMTYANDRSCGGRRG